MPALDPYERPIASHRLSHRPFALEEPLFALRPSFLPARQVPAHLALGVFFGLWGALFVGGLVNTTLRSYGYEGSALVPMLTSGLLFLALPPALSYRRLRRSYEDTVLALYADRLEFHGHGRHRIIPREQVHSIRLQALSQRGALGTLVVNTEDVDAPGAPLTVPDVTAPVEARARLLGWLEAGPRAERDLHAA